MWQERRVVPSANQYGVVAEYWQSKPKVGLIHGDSTFHLCSLPPQRSTNHSEHINCVQYSLISVLTTGLHGKL